MKFVNLKRGSKMKNIAHRGFSGKYPENTRVAFEKAIEIGADMIELDITISKDKIPVVIHDDTLDRTTSGVGKVRNTSFQKLIFLDAGSWKNPKFSEEKIPTLEEVLSLIKKSKIGLNIEIKSSAYEKNISESCIEIQTLRLIEKYKLQKRIVISSFETKVLLRLRELSPKVNLAFLIEPNHTNLKLNAISFVKKIHASSLNLHISQVGSGIYQDAIFSKIPVYVYTVNTTKEMKKMRQVGVAGIFTNYPDRLKKIILTPI